MPKASDYRDNHTKRRIKQEKATGVHQWSRYYQIYLNQNKKSAFEGGAMSPSDDIWLHPSGEALSLEESAAQAENWDVLDGTYSEFLISLGYTKVDLQEPTYSEQYV